MNSIFIIIGLGILAFILIPAFFYMLGGLYGFLYRLFESPFSIRRAVRETAEDQDSWMFEGWLVIFAAALIALILGYTGLLVMATIRLFW